MTPAAGPPSNLDKVLATVGRASTPPVKPSSFGITRGALIGLDEHQAHAHAVVVGAHDLLTELPAGVEAVCGVPGLLLEQVRLPRVRTLVIDWRAFTAGPWLGANTHAALSLTEELFEAGRIMRASGRQVIGIPVRPFLGSGDARILSTCTVDMTKVPAVDLEEGAPQGALWTALWERFGHAVEDE